MISVLLSIHDVSGEKTFSQVMFSNILKNRNAYRKGTEVNTHTIPINNGYIDRKRERARDRLCLVKDQLLVRGAS